METTEAKGTNTENYTNQAGDKKHKGGPAMREMRWWAHGFHKGASLPSEEELILSYSWFD